MKHQATIVIGADHPALAGHFPGEPVVPGVVILDEVRALAESRQSTHWVCAVTRVKFTAPLYPNEQLTIDLELSENECRFGCRKGETPVSQGVLRLASLT